MAEAAEYRNAGTVEFLHDPKRSVSHFMEVNTRQIKSKLLFHGVELPDGLGGKWPKRFLGWLASSPTGCRTLDVCLATLVRSYRELTSQIQQLSAEIEQLAQSEAYAERVALLCTIKGIGVLTAMCVLVELEDLDRFESEERLASFLGLVPGEHSTDERSHKGPITRTGNKRVRTVLVEASWRLIRYDADLRAFYERLRNVNKRGGKGCDHRAQGISGNPSESAANVVVVVNVVVNARVVIDVIREPERWSRASELVQVHVQVEEYVCDDV